MAGLILLSASEMRAVEDAAMKAGVSSKTLMETAGEKVAEAVMRGWTPRPVTVLAGPGNNGGDGFVAARVLKNAGWDVKVMLMGDQQALRGDAKLMAEIYEGEVVPLSPQSLEGAGLIIDALFGTGLSRPLTGEALEIVTAANAYPAPILSVDIPSGVNADTGAFMGAAIQAARTVTFFQKKPGHVLFPGGR